MYPNLPDYDRYKLDTPDRLDAEVDTEDYEDWCECGHLYESHAAACGCRFCDCKGFILHDPNPEDRDDDDNG